MKRSGSEMEGKKAKVFEVSTKANKRNKHRVIPVTLISGFLGAGKTTLLKHILENKTGLKVAVIVNDMATLNIDASLIEMSGLIQTKEEIVHLQNGCICCTLRGDLIREISKISENKRFDYIVIESTGISNPMEVAESFLLDVDTLSIPGKDDKKGRLLSSIAKLDTCITVVDAFELQLNLSSIESLGHKFSEENPPDAEKPITQLLLDQIEFSNVIILNKTDLVSASSLFECKSLLTSINPVAKVIEACNAIVDINEVLNTGSFSIEGMQSSPMWLRSLSDQHVHVPETEEYGILSFIYKARKPFSPSKLHAWISKYFMLREEIPEGVTDRSDLQDAANERKEERISKFGNIFRSKGFLWLSTRNNDMIEMELSGSIVSLQPLHTWYANVEESEWNLSEEETAIVKGNFAGAYGDRRQEIVFIGTALDEEAITNSLNDCLISDGLFRNHKANSWLKEIDPFPLWELSLYAGFWATILSESKWDLINIPEHHNLHITSAALEQTAACIENKTVRVWLDYDSGKSSVLIATLGTGRENVVLSLNLPGDTTVTFRVEELPKTSLTCFVHLVGVCNVQASGERDHDSDH